MRIDRTQLFKIMAKIILSIRSSKLNGACDWSSGESYVTNGKYLLRKSTAHDGLVIVCLGYLFK